MHLLPNFTILPWIGSKAQEQQLNKNCRCAPTWLWHLIINQHQSSPISTNQYQSAPIRINLHQSKIQSMYIDINVQTICTFYCIYIGIGIFGSCIVHVSIVLSVYVKLSIMATIKFVTRLCHKTQLEFCSNSAQVLVGQHCQCQCHSAGHTAQFCFLQTPLSLSLSGCSGQHFRYNLPEPGPVLWISD